MLSRVLPLYGAFTLFSNLAFLFGYYLLSPGITKKHPAAMIAPRVAEASGFWWEFAAVSPDGGLTSDKGSGARCRRG